MSYWNSFLLTTREWIIVLYAVIIVFMIISMIALTICIMRNCCYVICTGDDEISCTNGRINSDGLIRNANKTFTPNTTNAERDVIITVPQQVPLTDQLSHTKSSDVNRTGEACPIHGQKKYHNNFELQKKSLLLEDGHIW
ncbi:hypothetical protein ACH3XW_10635 [Acanthocheilonema viteae]